MISRLKNTMGNLPRDIDDGPIKITKVDLTPRGRPVKRSEDRGKHRLEVRRAKIDRQQIKVGRLCGHTRYQTKLVRVKRRHW